MSSAYNLPLHGNPQNGDAYPLDDSYPQDGVTSPGMGWDGQGDGGGKFRLKRRRRCGQCGPCQVKENCNKCQYCMRKDVLKQACVYRKCVYLRKPVPRFRQEPATPGVVSQKSAPTPPHKPTSTPVPPAPPNSASNSSSNITNSGNNNGSSSVTPVPNPSMTSVAAVDIAPASNSELSSCKLNQPSFASLSSMQGLNNGVLDPLRHRMMEHPHRSLFDPMNFHSTLDPLRGSVDPSKPGLADARFPSGTTASGLNTHCKLDQGASVINYASDINPAAVAVASPLNSANSALGTHQCYQPNKGSGLPSRDPYFPSMDTWSSVPYALPHASTWAAPSLPNHHAAAAAAAAYGFQQHPTPFPPSFTPSCRLGLPDSAAAQFASPAGPQPSFHHSMTGMSSFSQDFSHATSHATMRGPVNTPFYHTPPHIPPSSISSFHGLSQFPTAQNSFGPAAYSVHPHAHMYPSGFYSFRAATEPQIYHLEVYPSQNPFKHTLRELSFLFPWEKGMGSKTAHFPLEASKDFGHDISERLHQDLVSPERASETTTCKGGGEISSEHNQAQISCIPYNTLGSVEASHTCSDNVVDMITSTVEIRTESILNTAVDKKEGTLPNHASDVSICFCDCSENILHYKLPKGNFVCSNKRLFIACSRKDVDLATHAAIFNDVDVVQRKLTILTRARRLRWLRSKVIGDNETFVGVSLCSRTQQAINISANLCSESLTLYSLSVATLSSFLFVVNPCSQMNIYAAFAPLTLLPCRPLLHSLEDGEGSGSFRRRKAQRCTYICFLRPTVIITDQHLVVQLSRTIS